MTRVHQATIRLAYENAFGNWRKRQACDSTSAPNAQSRSKRQESRSDFFMALSQLRLLMVEVRIICRIANDHRTHVARQTTKRRGFIWVLQTQTSRLLK